MVEENTSSAPNGMPIPKINDFLTIIVIVVSGAVGFFTDSFGMLFNIESIRISTRWLIYFLVLFVAISVSAIVYIIRLYKWCKTTEAANKTITEMHKHLTGLYKDKIDEERRQEFRINQYKHAKITILGKYLAAIAEGNNGAIIAAENSYLQTLDLIEREFH